MLGLTGWTVRSIAVGAFVEYAVLLPFSSCIWSGSDTLDCDRAAHQDTHLGLLTYGLVKGAFIATEAAASLAVYISKATTFRAVGANA